MHSLLMAWAIVVASPGTSQNKSPEADRPLIAGPMHVLGFEENIGQVSRANGAAAPFVRYRFSAANTTIFLLESSVAFQFTGTRRLMEAPEQKPPQGNGRKDMLNGVLQPCALESYRMDMLLERANAHPSVTALHRSKDYIQYYNRNALDVHTFDTVIYHDVYPGIDWLWHTTADGVAHEFLVHPGADPRLIRLRFRHFDDLFLDPGGNLVHGNPLGRFLEKAPVSYQNGGSVPTHFVLKDDVLSFSLSHYDPGIPLIIDPDRIWATYYGGSQDDFGYDCASGMDGNAYMAGSTMSVNDIADSGFQDTLMGSWDAFLVKFDANGQRLWATYYGGEANDQGSACTTDMSGNVLLAGMTRSVDHISYNGFQDSLIGLRNGFLVKFDASGQRLWATYCGGGDDAASSIAVDALNNIYLAGDIYSYGQPTDLTTGGFQNYPGGWMDAFLVKFNADGERIWGSYYGGIDDDHGHSCSVDAMGNPYLAGMTYSLNGIAYQGFQSTLGALGTDAFLVKFDSAGHRLWGTYYGGDFPEEGGTCATDPGGSVYLAGTTQSSDGIADGGYQNTFGGELDAFLVKFSGTGDRIWGTYYGPDTMQYGQGCAVNDAGEVFLTGLTSSHWGIASAGFQDTFGGGLADAYLVKFDGSGARLWGTYYGGSGDESSEACAVGNDGAVYLAGWTASPDAISYLGCQETLGGSFDAFMVKFDDTTTEDVHDDPDPIRGLCAWPNPVRDVLHLNMVTDGWLLDELGRSVHQIHQSKDVPLRDISPGTYLLRTSDGRSLSIVKE
jgi:hypothetical protein